MEEEYRVKNLWFLKEPLGSCEDPNFFMVDLIEAQEILNFIYENKIEKFCIILENEHNNFTIKRGGFLNEIQITNAFSKATYSIEKLYKYTTATRKSVIYYLRREYRVNNKVKVQCDEWFECNLKPAL